MPRELDTIVRLQRVLNSLGEAERQLAGVPDWMEELHAEHGVRLAEIETLEADVEASAQARRKAEAASADAEVKLKHFQQQVSQVRTQREYAAILQEIDTVKGQIRGYDEDALGQIEVQDEARSALEQKRADFQDLDQRYAEALARWEEQKPAVAERAAALRREADELRAALPRNLLALFDRLLSHRPGDAVAPVLRTDGPGGTLYHCAACNYRVRLKVVSDIKSHHALVQCDGCKRILHVPEDAV